MSFFFNFTDSQNLTTAPYRYTVEKQFPNSQGELGLTVFQGADLSFSTVDIFPRICRTFPFKKFKVSPGIAEVPFD